MPNTQKNLDVIIRLVADTLGAKTVVNEMGLVSDAAKQLNLTLGNNFKVVSSGTKVFQTAAGPISRLNTVIDDGSKTLKNLTFDVKNANGQLNVVAGSAKVAANSFDLLSVKSAFAGINIGKLLGRALATIPVWFAIRQALAGLSKVFNDSIKFAKDFEEALSEVRVVGDEFSDGDIKNIGQAILNLGSTFGTSFKDASEAAAIFAQQGKNTEEILTLLPVAAKASIISGRSLKDTVEDLTAITKSYNLEASSSVRILDAITAVQLKFAISTKELSDGLRKLSPVAAALNISFEDQIGLITAVQGQTRRTGTETANSLKTILTRLQGDVLQVINTIARVPVFLDEFGNATNKTTGDVRPLTDILGDLAAKWNVLSEEQRNALGDIVAGKRQIIEFNALMQNYRENIQSSVTALISQGEAQRAVEIKTTTLAGELKKLEGSYTQFIASVTNPGGFNALNAFLKNQTQQLRGLINLLAVAFSPQKFDDIFLNQENLVNEQEVVRELTVAYQKLASEKKRFSDAFANQSNNAAELEGFKRQAEDVATANAEALNKVFSSFKIKFEPTDTKDIQSVLDALKKSTVEISPVIAQDSINRQIKEVQDKLNKVTSKSLRDVLTGFVDETGNAKEAKTLKERLNFLKSEQALKEEIAKTETAINTQLSQKLNLEKSFKQIQEEITELEIKLTSQGKSQIAIERTKLDFLLKQARENRKISILPNGQEFITDQELRKEVDKLKLKLEQFKTEQNINALKAEEEIIVQKLIGLGANDLDVQRERIALARERMAITGDETELLQEQFKLQQLIAEKQAQVASELKSTVSSALKDVINGKSDFGDFFTKIEESVNDRIAQSFSNLLTEGFFKVTGIGSSFGGLITGIEDAFKGVPELHRQGIKDGADLLKDKIIEAAEEHARLIREAIQEGQASKDSQKDDVVNKFSPSTRKLLDFFGAKDHSDQKIPGVLQGVRDTGSFINVLDEAARKMEKATRFASDGFATTGRGGGFDRVSGLFGNLSGGLGKVKGLFGSGLGGLFGGLGSLSSGLGNILGPIGAGLGLFNFFRGLFRKPKRTVSVQEETRDFQIASKIDVSNEQLKIVNRNLIALKQSFDTFILPDSAAFAEKRNLADQFAINAKRGLA